VELSSAIDFTKERAECRHGQEVSPSGFDGVGASGSAI
jgi:hypothetical protein